MPVLPSCLVNCAVPTSVAGSPSSGGASPATPGQPSADVPTGTSDLPLLTCFFATDVQRQHASVHACVQEAGFDSWRWMLMLRAHSPPSGLKCRESSTLGVEDPILEARLRTGLYGALQQQTRVHAPPTTRSALRGFVLANSLPPLTPAEAAASPRSLFWRCSLLDATRQLGWAAHSAPVLAASCVPLHARVDAAGSAEGTDSTGASSPRPAHYDRPLRGHYSLPLAHVGCATADGAPAGASSRQAGTLCAALAWHALPDTEEGDTGTLAASGITNATLSLRRPPSAADGAGPQLSRAIASPVPTSPGRIACDFGLLAVPCTPSQPLRSVLWDLRAPVTAATTVTCSGWLSGPRCGRGGKRGRGRGRGRGGGRGRGRGRGGGAAAAGGGPAGNDFTAAGQITMAAATGAATDGDGDSQLHPPVAALCALPVLLHVSSHPPAERRHSIMLYTHTCPLCGARCACLPSLCTHLSAFHGHRMRFDLDLAGPRPTITALFRTTVDAPPPLTLPHVTSLHWFGGVARLSSNSSHELLRRFDELEALRARLVHGQRSVRRGKGSAGATARKAAPGKSSSSSSSRTAGAASAAAASAATAAGAVARASDGAAAAAAAKKPKRKRSRPVKMKPHRVIAGVPLLSRDSRRRHARRLAEEASEAPPPVMYHSLSTVEADPESRYDSDLEDCEDWRKDVAARVRVVGRCPLLPASRGPCPTHPHTLSGRIAGPG